MDTDPQDEREPPSKMPWVLVAIAIIASGGMGYAAWKALLQADAAQNGRDDALRRFESTDKARAELERKLAASEKDKAELASRTEQLQANLSQTEAELSRLKATYDSLQDKMKAEIGRGDIRLSQSGNTIQVDLVDKILFDSGEAVVSERGQEVLGRLASVLKTIDDKQIQVSGHTDDSPIKNEELRKQFPSNWELSVARAVNVVRSLSETGGVPAQRLLAAGYGQFHPIAANGTPAGRAQNRRIEILLTPAVVAKKGTLAVPVAVAAPGPTAGPVAAARVAASKPAAAKPKSSVARGKKK